jgi:hypothetical protein
LIEEAGKIGRFDKEKEFKKLQIDIEKRIGKEEVVFQQGVSDFIEA